MNLKDPIFSDETKVRAYFEAIRWPDGIVCPHCGGTERVYRLCMLRACLGIKGRQSVLKDTHIILITCDSCGHESHKEVGWLRKRAGRKDMICANLQCRASFEDYTKELAFIVGDHASNQHEAVNHNKEYARDSNNGRVHTNTAEGYFSIFKRGLIGTYQHISPAHLPRYLAEFDFRMNNRVKLGVNDDTRAERILRGAENKRLTYRQVG